jgi:hypothetical protein
VASEEDDRQESTVARVRRRMVDEVGQLGLPSKADNGSRKRRQLDWSRRTVTSSAWTPVEKEGAR